MLCVYYHLLLYLTLGFLHSDCCCEQLECPAHTYCLSVCECNACRLSHVYSDIVHYILRDGTSLDLFGILIVSVCVNIVACVLFRTGALGPLMGSEDLCDAQFAGPVSVESIEVQSDHQGSLLLVFPCCHTGISWGRRCDKAFLL